MRKNKICGVYQIRNKISDRVYIGSSNNIYLRFRVHRRDLCANEHFNSKLQNAWNKYGGGNFEFEIVEICSEEERTDKEQMYIDTMHPFYNVSKTVKVPYFKAGTPESMLRSQKNVEARRKSEWCNSDEYHAQMSEIMLDRWKNPKYRKLRSKNTKALWDDPKYKSRQSAAHSKLSDDDRRKIKELTKEGYNSIALAAMFSVSRGTISRVINNKWTHHSVVTGQRIGLDDLEA